MKKDYQPRIVYVAKLFIKNKIGIKTFPGKEN